MPNKIAPFSKARLSQRRKPARMGAGCASMK
jgi:hypothetical protein